LGYPRGSPDVHQTVALVRPNSCDLAADSFGGTSLAMRTLSIAAGAAIALTTGAAVSLQATRPPAGSDSAASASNLPSSASSSATNVDDIPSPGPASAIAVRQVHTVPILEPKATQQGAAEAASPPESSKIDQRALEPAPRDRGSVGDVGNPSAPLIVASRPDETIETRPDQPLVKPHREAFRASEATVTPGLSSRKHSWRTPGDRQRKVRKAPLTAVDIIDAAEASNATAASGNPRALAAQGTSSPPSARRWRTISELVTR
jgi:hypothetical protein